MDLTAEQINHMLVVQNPRVYGVKPVVSRVQFIESVISPSRSSLLYKFYAYLPGVNPQLAHVYSRSRGYILPDGFNNVIFVDPTVYAPPLCGLVYSEVVPWSEVWRDDRRYNRLLLQPFF